MYWITKLLVFILVFACVVVIREFASFLLAVFSFRTNEDASYTITKARLWLLALSLSYIFTIIFTGFRIL